MEVSAADFTQPDVAHTQPACKQPGPGDPPYHTPQPGINVASASSDEQYCVAPEPDIALAYSLVEPARSGRLVVDAAVALGVKPGRHFHDLKSGQSVLNQSGVTVHPEQVCSPVCSPAKHRCMLYCFSAWAAPVSMLPTLFTCLDLKARLLCKQICILVPIRLQELLDTSQS